MGKIINKRFGSAKKMYKNRQKRMMDIIRPQIYLEEPRRLTIPIVISPYRQPTTTIAQTTVQTLQRPRRWTVRHKQKPTTLPTVKKRGTNICKWYRRKQALKELQEYNKTENLRQLKNRQNQERRERELQLKEYFKLQEQTKLNDSSSPSSSYGKGEVIKLEKAKKPQIDRKAQRRAEKERKEWEKRNREFIKLQEREDNYPFERGEVPIKKTRRVKVRKFKATKTSWAKPKAATRSVTVKRQYRNENLSNRFVNCFYRVCCQFYCYLTCFLIVGFIIIMVI